MKEKSVALCKVVNFAVVALAWTTVYLGWAVRQMDRPLWQIHLCIVGAVFTGLFIRYVRSKTRRVTTAIMSRVTLLVASLLIAAGFVIEALSLLLGVGYENTLEAAHLPLTSGAIYRHIVYWSVILLTLAGPHVNQIVPEMLGLAMIAPLVDTFMGYAIRHSQQTSE